MFRASQAPRIPSGTSAPTKTMATSFVRSEIALRVRAIYDRPCFASRRSSRGRDTPSVRAASAFCPPVVPDTVSTCARSTSSSVGSAPSRPAAPVATRRHARAESRRRARARARASNNSRARARSLATHSATSARARLVRQHGQLRDAARGWRPRAHARARSGMSRRALAQRRQRDLDDAQPVVEILAERAARRPSPRGRDASRR